MTAETSGEHSRFNPHKEAIRHYPNKHRHLSHLSPEVRDALVLATEAEMHGKEDDAKTSYANAARLARNVYETILPSGITKTERLKRGEHAKMAVLSFIKAGEKTEALNLGAIATHDFLVSAIHRRVIGKAINPLKKKHKGPKPPRQI